MIMMKVLCEYLDHAIGIDCARPRFSWRLRKQEKGKQKTYRVIVSRSCDLTKTEFYMWDSGEVISDQAFDILYSGKTLDSVSTYYYQVTIKDAEGNAYASDIKTLTTGLIDKSLWKAEWTGVPGMYVEAPVCRTHIRAERDFEKVYAFVLTPNYYVLTVNGERVTDTVLNNANTDPKKTVPYLMMDITDYLRKGENVVGLSLGKGWAGLRMTTAGEFESIYKFSMQIALIDAEGNKQWIYPDAADFEFLQNGPIVYDSIYHGEVYDARKEIPHWDCADHDKYEDDNEWHLMVEAEPEEGEICSQILEPIRCVETIRPIAVYPLADGSYTFDFGRNFAGWARLKVSGNKGDKVMLSYAEMEFEDHRINRLSVRAAKATDTYILKGAGEEIYEPDFTFHGFRYVNVQGLSKTPQEDTVTGRVIQSDIRKIASFECSEPLLNRLYQVVSWTEEANRHSIPTDCPQREERLGWTNDMSVRNECALYSYDLVKFYEKWMRDIRDTQKSVTGALADTAPRIVYGAVPMDPIAITPVNLPWNVYCFYGDKKILEDNYQMNVKWLSYLERNSDDGIVRYSHMGDWAGPAAGTCAKDEEGVGGGAVSTITPTILVATASIGYMYKLMAKTAQALGRTEDVKLFTRRAEATKKAFIKHFYHKEGKYFGKNSQGANTIALYTGMIPEEDKQEILNNLVKDIVEANDMHVTTGNLCSRYILEVLFQNGYTDIAYELLTQTTYPSWGYMISKGATTIWERWEDVTEPGSVVSEMASCNHPMYGAFAICFHKYLAGICPDEENPGFRKIKICPHIPKKLDSLKAEMDTNSGWVKVEWQKKGGSLELDVTIPFNCIGEIAVPVNEERAIYEVPAGIHHFTVKEEKVIYGNL